MTPTPSVTVDLVAWLRALIPNAGMTIWHYPATEDNPLGIGPFAETLRETADILEARIASGRAS